MCKTKEKLSEIGKNKESLGGYDMKIVEFNKYKDIIVEFQDKHKSKVHTNYQAFLKGEVKNPYHPSVCGVGYLGQGKYKVSENGKHTKAYKYWKNMLNRCYNPYELNKEPTYINCYVCEEWYNFQNFAKWYEENYYEIEGEKMCLDKDILVKNNKIYSPETCMFVPERINSLFIKQSRKRGKYPIGVCWRKDINKFQVKYSILDKNNEKKRIHLGYYDTSKEAFLVYKKYKESYIKQVADEYKDLIPQKLYEGMYNWIVEIGD